MMKLLREWGFPIGLLALWAIAVAYSLNAVAGMQSTLQPTQLPSQSVPVMARLPVVSAVPSTAHAS